tara:strand:- start:1218 stop:2366 length:1149 start_codon:yes stop_codon:yes gene_type:complete
MAGSFKELGSNDIVSTRTLLHESIPLTGTIVSGTYNAGTTEYNIKNYSHGMFQSVYDYPYLSSSANHIFDITVGVSPNTALTITSQQSKKQNIYNQMAQVLMGYDHTGSIQEFDEDGNILVGGTKLREVFFLNFSRLLSKDEIKKGTFELELGEGGSFIQNGTTFLRRIKLTDVSGSDGYFTNSPAGEYGVLFAETTYDGDATLSGPLVENEVIVGQVSQPNTKPACGLLFYQAGIAVISGSVFNDTALGGILDDTDSDAVEMGSTWGDTGFNHITGSEISASADAIRNRIYNLQFNNTTELNSTIYFCRANHNEFNYSANPTYLSGSKVRVKTNSTDSPVSYITTVGLYSDNNELMAVAKLSEPLKKGPDTEFTLRTRLDY